MSCDVQNKIFQQDIQLGSQEQGREARERGNVGEYRDPSPGDLDHGLHSGVLSLGRKENPALQTRATASPRARGTETRPLLLTELAQWENSEAGADCTAVREHESGARVDVVQRVNVTSRAF